MKKLSLLLAGVMFILSMTACTEGGGKAKDTTAKVTAVAADTTAAENTTIQTENSTAEITTTNTEETTAKTESASLTTKDSHISIDNSTEVTYVFDNCAELNAWIATISDDTVNKVNAVGVEKNAEYIKTFI